MKIGIIGAGQLGRMLALAGYPLGLRFVFLDHSTDAPGAQVGRIISGAFDDAVTFMGSGGRLDGDRVIFAAPTHKMDRIQSVVVGDTLYVSNSLVLLLTSAGEEIDRLLALGR